MHLVMVLTIAAAFILTIWFCWFTLNLTLDTSRSTYSENRRYVRTNLLFASVMIIFIAVMYGVLRAGHFING